MENQIISAIQELKKYWDSQFIDYDIFNEKHDLRTDISFLMKINDFRLFYSHVNGMTDLFPNEMDANGFLIYPAQNIEVLKTDTEKVFLFADYLQRCWWYGIKILDNNEYEIGIVKEKGKFEKRYNFLSDFIFCYINDCESLY